MISKQRVFLIFASSLSLASIPYSQTTTMSNVIYNIFLTKAINSSSVENILISARETFSMLRNIHAKSEDKKDFVNYFGNFFLKLFNDLQTNGTDIQNLFHSLSTYLKGSIHGSRDDFKSVNVSESELRTEIMHVLMFIESHLAVHHHYNTTNEEFNVPEILAMNDSSFDSYLKQKLRIGFSDSGYFLLEVFATLIAFSWGVISFTLHGIGVVNEYPVAIEP